MSHFAIGEIAFIGGQVGERSIYNGIEVTVLDISYFANEPAYQIDLDLYPGRNTYARARDLRKHAPPESGESAARQEMLDCIERAKMGQGAHV